MSLETLSKRIETTKDLRNIVSTMKALSSASVAQYEKAQAALENYLLTIREAFHALIVNRSVALPKVRPPAQEKALVILVGSDNGLVGPFNRDMIQRVTKALEERHLSPQKNALFVTVGKRLQPLVKQEQWPSIGQFALTNSLKLVNQVATDIILHIEKYSQQVSRVDLFYHRRNGSKVHIEHIKIWPYSQTLFDTLKQEKWPTNNIPQCTESTTELSTFLLRERLIVTLASALIMSLSAEHYTRMLHMQEAEHNIDDQLEEMTLAYQQARQENITEELIDIVTTTQVLSD